ncbi:hypothetical protein ASC70_14335 [Caulobacter sp. Root343]|nr:hypothetical protein ASC62_14235 [Caulobacter sp. Root342]KQV66979.1 hypothetical protein ASC70_14335 [Caulobacter sp. Root343]
MAWLTLFSALRSAGFHPLAYTILQSENELDPWRQKGRACSLDLLLELSPHPAHEWGRHRTEVRLGTAEESYLLTIGDAFLSTATAPKGWEESFVATLRAHPFLATANDGLSATDRIAAE